MTALKWLREVLQSANTVLLKDHIFLTIGLHVSRLGSRLLKNKYLWVPFHYTCLSNKTRKPSKHNHVNQAYTWLLKHKLWKLVLRAYQNILNINKWDHKYIWKLVLKKERIDLTITGHNNDYHVVLRSIPRLLTQNSHYPRGRAWSQMKSIVLLILLVCGPLKLRTVLFLFLRWKMGAILEYPSKCSNRMLQRSVAP